MSTEWSFAIETGPMLVALVLCLGVGALSYLQWERRQRARSVALLEFLRWGIVCLLLFALMRPELVQRIERKDPPEIVILEDGSASMTTRDLQHEGRPISREDWLKEMEKRNPWKELVKSGRIVRDRFSNVRTNTLMTGSSVDAPLEDEGTDLGGALERVLSGQRNCKAVLLLTDGDWNTGKNPVGVATRYRSEEIPVFAVVTGRETAMPDLVLERVLAPSYGLMGERVVMPFKVRSQLGREVRTSVAIVRSGREEGKKEIVIPALGGVEDALLWTPQEPGEYVLEIKLPVENEESLRQNNEQKVNLSIRAEKLTVLVVDSEPRWEYRYLRNALERDPGVEMQSILYHPGMPIGGGRRYLSSFPGTKEMLSKYDVIFLGDVGVGEGQLHSRELEMIKGVVEQQGSGLVLIPGNRGRQKTLWDGEFKELAPVSMEEGKADGIVLQNESSLLLTPAGKAHWLTRFESDEVKNEEIWRNLPGFYWNASVLKSRPGSEVLAVHSSLRNSWGRIPLLVTRPQGNGKVLFMGTDSAWRWRRGVEDKYHYRFWGQVVRWMAHQRHMADKDGIRVVYSPEAPRGGEPVLLQATITDANGVPIEKGPVVGIATGPDGKGERLEFEPVAGGWGLFRASFTPRNGGKYALSVSAERQGRQSRIDLHVGKPVLEHLGRPANFQSLREVTQMTRGAMGSVEEFEKILAQIAVLPEPKPLERRVRIWSHPLFGGLILILLAAYWVGRKLAGMV